MKAGTKDPVPAIDPFALPFSLKEPALRSLFFKCRQAQADSTVDLLLISDAFANERLNQISVLKSLHALPCRADILQTDLLENRHFLLEASAQVHARGLLSERRSREFDSMLKSISKACGMSDEAESFVEDAPAQSPS